MGFLRSTLRVLSDVTSLGGTARIRHWTDRHRELLELYQRIRADIESENSGLVSAVAELKRNVATATKLLGKAAKILDPLGEGQRALNSAAGLRGTGRPNREITQVNAPRNTLPKELAITAAGVGVGTGTAFASWGVVQGVAHASTGTAMAAIHGAAAANAGWAWFGGGALAAGGGGMALGHIILPGIGTATAVTVSSVIAHREANRLSEMCREVEGANSANQHSLATLKSHASQVRDWERRLEREYELLKKVVQETGSRLFPLGFVNRFWRWCRVRLGGQYYHRHELYFVDQLDSAVTGFLDAFRSL